MNTLEKIKRSWWVIFSVILFLNGFGFIYIGFKHNNKNWVLEGLTYEFPWFFYFIAFAIYESLNAPTTLVLSLALMLLLVSIIRSIWVAVKLADVYDNREKYTIKQTVLATPVNGQNNDNVNSKIACCLCLFVIFIVFAIIAI